MHILANLGNNIQHGAGSVSLSLNYYAILENYVKEVQFLRFYTLHG